MELSPRQFEGTPEYDLNPGFGRKKNTPQQGTLFRGGPRLPSAHRGPAPAAMSHEDIDEWFAGRPDVVSGKHSTYADLDTFRSEPFKREEFGAELGAGFGDGVYFTPSDTDDAEEHQQRYGYDLPETYDVVAAPRGGFARTMSDPEETAPVLGVGGSWEEGYRTLPRQEIFNAAGALGADLSRPVQQVYHEAGVGGLHITDFPWEHAPDDDHPDWDPGWDSASPGVHGSQAVVFDPNDVKIVDRDADPVDRKIMKRRRRHLRKHG